MRFFYSSRCDRESINLSSSRRNHRRLVGDRNTEAPALTPGSVCEGLVLSLHQMKQVCVGAGALLLRGLGLRITASFLHSVRSSDSFRPGLGYAGPGSDTDTNLCVIVLSVISLASLYVRTNQHELVKSADLLPVLEQRDQTCQNGHRDA